MSEAATGQTQTDPGVTQTDGATTTTVADTTTVDQQQQQQGTEQKGAEGDNTQASKTDEKPGEQGGKDDAKPTPKAPEQYEEFTAPEGVALDPALSGDLKTLAKDLDLTQEQAQKVADLGARMVTKQTEALTAAATEWEAQARADTEYGGDAFEDNLGVAKKAVDAFATPELKKLLNETRLGSHPEVIRFMVRAGKAISQDRFVGGRAAAGTRSTEDRLYANTKSK